MAKNKEIVMQEELKDLINAQEGDFIIHVTLGEETDNG
jgi:hypothetical protein